MTDVVCRTCGRSHLTENCPGRAQSRNATAPTLTDKYDDMARDFDRKWRGPNLDYEAMMADFAATIRKAVEDEREACCQIIEACARSLDHHEGETFKNVMWPIEDIRARGG